MSKKEPDVFTIEETDFPNAWARAVRQNIKFGFNSNGANEHIMLIRLTKNAIDQVLNNEVHQQFPFGVKSIEEYCKEFTYEYLENYLKLPKEKQFEYLYFERFARYPMPDGKFMNQIDVLRDNLLNSVNSRQLQMITYIPYIDAFSADPPCLQRIQVRQIASNLVDLHYTFRSWDVYGAFPSNVIAITKMMKVLVLKRDYDINSINVMGRSAHTYDNDLTSANHVRVTPKMRGW